jgi:hypothetical protein
MQKKDVNKMPKKPRTENRRWDNFNLVGCVDFFVFQRERIGA